MGQHPQHDKGQLVGPVVALQMEQQESASAALTDYLQRGGRRRGRPVPGHEAGAQLRTTSPAVRDTAEERERTASPELPGASAKARLEALRARVAAKAAGCLP